MYVTSYSMTFEDFFITSLYSLFSEISFSYFKIELMNSVALDKTYYVAGTLSPIFLI